METFETIIERGCGLDVHKDTVYACIAGKGIKKQIRNFSTMTDGLKQLSQWLKDEGITDVAMESTGVYWKPVYNILEEDFNLKLVNARHIKHVPGRKTDVVDCEWICKLLLSGLLKGSFVPERKIRELRDLTRYKKKLINIISAEKNRIEKILQDCNIKLSSVATDIFGVSGSLIMDKLLAGEIDVEKLSELCKGRLRKKREQMKEALKGVMRRHHIFMIETIRQHIDLLKKIIQKVDAEIEKRTTDITEELTLLTTIPGVNKDAAEYILAEIGTDMSVFPNEQHLASWAGLCPGNNESAGKKSSKTTHGNKYLVAILVECAWAASRTKNTYLSSKYKSLVGRRGKKRALIAVAHKILCAIYFMLKNKVGYYELGAEFLQSRRKDKVAESYIKKLKELGYEVKLNKRVA